MIRFQILLMLPLLAAVTGPADPPARPSCCQSATAPAEAAATASTLPAASLYALDARWTDQDGHTLQLGDLAGRVRVVAMIFTHCEYACPRILSELRELEASLPESADEGPDFVLISFDSARDDPATLRAYAARQDLPADRWTLLHGDAGTVRELSVLLDVPFREDADGNFSHASVISVLDRDGRLAFQKRGLGGPLDDCRRAIASARAEPRMATSD
jgi:protein SCO1/2